jgi:hypothetical protein
VTDLFSGDGGAALVDVQSRGLSCGNFGARQISRVSDDPCRTIHARRSMPGSGPWGAITKTIAANVRPSVNHFTVDKMIYLKYSPK